MKLFFVLLIVLLISFILFQTYLIMSVKSTPTQSYSVIETNKDFEVRFYPSVTMAMITSTATNYKDLGSLGFRKLAGYIFGSNEGNHKISMCSPVHMDINPETSSMGFVMPSHYTKESLPKPLNAEVSITTTCDEMVAVIAFGGFASDKSIRSHAKLLEDALKLACIEYYGNFRYLGYDPPYKLFSRKNEIIVSVNWEEKIADKTN